MQPNSLFELAARVINHTGQHLFLTGNAGTGKTTFLRHIRENTAKKTVVVAPTGVAAINAGGVTMHSFFHLPFGMFLPESRNYFGDEGNMQVVNKNTLFRNIRFSKDKIALVRELELLIIDEVSMLRADALDAMDTILRHYRRKDEPFGGVQVLYIGDLFQLPPVLTNHEARMFFEHYRTPFFFDALVMREAPPLVIELKHIYRQSDQTFINVLNAIRNNYAGQDEMDVLHERYMPQVQPERGCIMLTTHNARADEVNRQRLAELPGRESVFAAKISGDFNEHALPAEKELVLKAGAQVMFMKNDTGENRRWYNGMLATVTHIGSDGDIWVKPASGNPGQKDGTAQDIKVELHEWKNVRFKYNQEKDDIDEEELGSFRQYPLRLAWAITIHKSQGLTFDHAVVDAGKSFAPGQVYVALSRLSSLKGLILHSRIPAQGIAMPEEVIEFCRREKSEDALEQLVKTEEEEFARKQLSKWFQLDKLGHEIQDLYLSYQSRSIPDKEEAMEWCFQELNAAKGLQDTAHKFQQQLSALLWDAAKTGYGPVAKRVEAAAKWFEGALKENMLTPLEKHYKAWEKKSRSKQYLKDLKSLQALMLHLLKGWQQAVILSKGLAGGSELYEIDLTVKTPEPAVTLEAPTGSKAPKKGESAAMSLAMAKAGKTVAEIAKERSMTISTIEGHLANFIRSGELSVHQVVEKENLDLILKMVADKSDNTPLGELKALLPHHIGFGEIRAVLAHRAWRREAKVTG